MTIPYTRNDVSLPQWSIEGDSIVIYNVQMGGKEWDFRIQKPGSEVPGSFQLLERDLSELVRLCTDNLFASFSDNPVILRYTTHLAKENRSVEALDLINLQTKRASTSYADNDRMLEGARRINQIVGGNRTIFSSEEDLRYTHPTTPPVNPTPSGSGGSVFPQQDDFGRHSRKSTPEAAQSKTSQSTPNQEARDLPDDTVDLNLPSRPIPDDLKAGLADIQYQNLTFGEVAGKNDDRSTRIKNQIGELVGNASAAQYAELKGWIISLIQRTFTGYCSTERIDWEQAGNPRDKDLYRAHLAIQVILFPLLPSNSAINRDQLTLFMQHLAEYLNLSSLKKTSLQQPKPKSLWDIFSRFFIYI